MKQGKWICYPGDYAIYLAEKVQTRRFQRNVLMAPSWRVDSPFHHIRFFKMIRVAKEETIKISWEGRISVFFKRPRLELDDWYSYEFDGEITLPAGEHFFELWVYNPNGLPCLKIDGDTVVSDESFSVANDYVDLVPAEVCNCGDLTPNTYKLPVRNIDFVDKFEKNGDTVYDFGKEIYAYVSLKGTGDFKLYFGETLNEALNDTSKIKLLAEKPYFGNYADNASEYFCEQIENFSLPDGGEHTSEITKAFRYLRVHGGKHLITALEEYDDRGTVTRFSSDDDLLKRIFDVSLYTFSMCAREFYLDGAKRDRWIWGGDIYEAQKAEYYYQYNAERIKNSIIAAFGKPPVERFVNRIMDYTFYVINMVREYYERSGDKAFLEFILPVLTEHINLAVSRCDENGFVVTKKKNGRATDWIFVDWQDLPDTDGEVCLEQILFWKALKCVGEIYSVLDLDGSVYFERADALAKAINDTFWDEKAGVFIFACNNGVKDHTVTCHANIFAVLYGFANDTQKNSIIDNFKRDKISLSKTPFMIEFVLEMLFKNGEYEKGDKILRSFWGGMVKAGATTFWETYIDGETEETATAMYGRPFGRSLCHIWGAGALYIIPKFYFGIGSVDFGNAFVVQPNTELISGCSIKVPLKKGTLSVSCENGGISVFADELGGKLIIGGKEYSVSRGKRLTVGIR